MNDTNREPRDRSWSPSGCERVRARLDELCEGALSPLEAARDRGHLESCAECAEHAAERERWLAQLAHAASPCVFELEHALAGLEPRLAVARAPRPRASSRRFAVAAALAAGALFVLFLTESWTSGALSLQRAFAGAGHAASEVEWPAIGWPSSFVLERE